MESTARPSSVSTFYVGFGEISRWFAGNIDEVAYYSTALPPTASSSTGSPTRPPKDVAATLRARRR